MLPWGLCPGQKLPFETLRTVAILWGLCPLPHWSCWVSITVDYSHSRMSPVLAFQSQNKWCRGSNLGSKGIPP